jgi:hypothetical protein
MSSENINEKLEEKTIWNDPEFIEAFDECKDEHTSEITETNKPWRYDIDPEDLGLGDLKVEPVFIHHGNSQTCKLTKLPISRNTDLNKNFSQIKPKKLKKELALYIEENYTHVNSIIEHRQSAISSNKVVDMVYYMVHGVKIINGGNI